MTSTPSLYLSAPQPCPYLPHQTASTILLDPDLAVDQSLYESMVRHGFRRSGHMVYRPHCSECQACVSVRVPVHNFVANRAQRRIWRRNRDLRVATRRPRFDPQQFDLYRRYQTERHPGSTMDHPDPDKYKEFMVNSGVNTVFIEMYLHEQLAAVAVTDQLTDGLSAIYTFYEPDLAKRSLGSYSVLWQIENAKRQQLRWVYLGYWIERCEKMKYKAQFKPIEGFRDSRWSSLPDQ